MHTKHTKMRIYTKKIKNTQKIKKKITQIFVAKKMHTNAKKTHKKAKNRFSGTTLVYVNAFQHTDPRCTQPAYTQPDYTCSRTLERMARGLRKISTRTIVLSHCAVV
jgi:hypothetical protein